MDNPIFKHPIFKKAKKFYIDSLKFWTDLREYQMMSSRQTEKLLTGTYSNFKMYDKHGKRLAIFAEGDKDKIVFTVYKCSRQDNFNKREARDAFNTKNHYYHPDIFEIGLPFTRENVYQTICSKYYKLVDYVFTPTHAIYGSPKADNKGKYTYQDGKIVYNNTVIKKIKRGDILQ